MAPKYLSYHQRAAQASTPPDSNKSPWWRPLTNAWGIFGLILFIGLVLRVIDGATHGATRHPVKHESAVAPVPTGASSLSARAGKN